MRAYMKAKSAVVAITLALAATPQAWAWGDDGHKTVALIAQQCLRPAVRQQITSMLAADTDNLAAHDIASAATWADRYRDSNNRKDHYEQTKEWHFADMEIDNPDLNAACFGRDPLKPGVLASNGPPKACVVDKIKQFEAELAAKTIDAEERLFALKFILHFVGDLHQPLHSSDHDDQGGNQVTIKVEGFPRSGKLHSFWDTQFVDALGTPPTALAKTLLRQITPDDARAFAQGTPEDWQLEAFNIAKADAYGDPPLPKNKTSNLDSDYADTAKKDVSLQLRRAGVRLAELLNRSLGTEPTDWDSCLKMTSDNQGTKKKKKRQRRRR
jgi:S1/P1 Nuclease